MIRKIIKNLVSEVIPFDALEKEHIDDVLDWISSGVEIFRIKKDAIPPKHLVSYSVVIDAHQEKVFLLFHKKALRWLPSGGHVNIDEMPSEAAKRELWEELGLSLKLYSPNDQPDIPFFITVNQISGLVEAHTDVSFWYVFEGDSTQPFEKKGEDFANEFDDYKWFGFGEILSLQLESLDIHMHRFIKKLKSALV